MQFSFIKCFSYVIRASSYSGERIQLSAARRRKLFNSNSISEDVDSPTCSLKETSTSTEHVPALSCKFRPLLH